MSSPVEVQKACEEAIGLMRQSDDLDMEEIYNRISSLRAQLTMMSGDGLEQFRNLTEQSMEDVLEGMYVQLGDLLDAIEPARTLQVAMRRVLSAAGVSAGVHH